MEQSSTDEIAMAQVSSDADADSSISEIAETCTGKKALLTNADALAYSTSITADMYQNVLQVKFPSEEWSTCSIQAYRTKVLRLQRKVAELRRKRKNEEVSDFLKEPFQFPVSKISLSQSESSCDDVTKEKTNILVTKTKHVVQENRKLKRDLESEKGTNDNLELQIEHYETKTNMLLKLLESVCLKHKNVVSEKSKNVKLLAKDCQDWEKKYIKLSEDLDKNTELLANLRDKVKSSNVRNSNKKIKRRDEKIEMQKGEILMKETEVREKANEIEKLQDHVARADSKIKELKNDKRNLLVKVCRLSKKARDSQVSVLVERNESEISRLKAEIKAQESQISELEQLNSIIESPEIESFYEGKYSNEIRETIMTLVTEHGVSLKKVNDVIQTVVKNITGKTLSRLPSTGVRSRLLTEAKHVAQVQVATAMLGTTAIDTSQSGDGDVENSYYGNCLHQDGTSKFHRHFQSFQVTTRDKTTYSLGLVETGSGDAASLIESFQDQMQMLSDSLKKQDENNVAKLVTSIVATMSDQGSTNPVFNKKLEELRQTVLPDVVENWGQLSENTKTEMGKLSSFFCKMHIFVNMASEVDKCLALFENTVTSGKNPYSFEWKESGASRLTRTASKALTEQGCEKSGVGGHFSTFLKEKGAKNCLITFRGHRFNHLFYAAGATYHHKQHIIEFLDQWCNPNDLLKSISFDIRESAFISSIRALGIINKLITGPLWRVIESTDSILDLNPVLENLQEKLNQLSQDASPLLHGEVLFPEVPIHRDEVYESLFENSNDPNIEMYTQMALELSLSGMLLILERQAKDQLPGGRFYEPNVKDQMRGASVPTTNTCSERDFAQLDMLVRLKPSASTSTYEAIIMWSNNKTSEWLNSMPICEKSKLLDDARRGAPEMIEKFKERQRLLFEKKLEILRSKQEKKALMDAKQYTQKVRLTAKLQDVGGVWTCPGDIEHFKTSQGRVTLKEAIITQLQFRKTVLGSKGPREKFQQSLKGNPYSLSQLEQNLLDIIEINKENESLENADNSNSLSYFSEEQVQENIKEAKLKLSQKLREGRNKILINQQSSRLPELVERPETLVGKTIIHKFKEVGSNEITWYTGEVLSIHKANGRLTKYNVRYEDEELNRFPLLTDMEKGDLIIKD